MSASDAATPPLRTPKFIFFDLGNVLLFFDHRQAARQMAELTGCDAERIWNFVFKGGLNARLDAGEVTTEEFYDEFCCETGCRPDPKQLAEAASAIFQLNVPMNAVLAQLSAAGYRLGMLSNTCEMHWEYFASGRYRTIAEAFETVVLSCRLKLMKPDAKIYFAAADAADVAPEDVFYVDDILPNVEGARAAGFDAVQYTTTPAFVTDLRRRGMRFNY